MSEVLVFSAGFLAFTFGVGHILRTRGRVFLDHTFGAAPAVAESVHVLLNLGFYLMCAGLFLWNLGLPGPEDASPSDALRSASLRLGVCIFVVAGFHSLNLLVLSILNRNNQSLPGSRDTGGFHQRGRFAGPGVPTRAPTGQPATSFQGWDASVRVRGVTYAVTPVLVNRRGDHRNRGYRRLDGTHD